jgi:hypothetical protein
MAPKKHCGTAHPAALGLEHMMRTIPANKKSETLAELKRTTGMTKTQMLEHIGNRILHGMPPKKPSVEEVQANQRLSLLK